MSEIFFTGHISEARFNLLPPVVKIRWRKVRTWNLLLLLMLLLLSLLLCLLVLSLLSLLLLLLLLQQWSKFLLNVAKPFPNPIKTSNIWSRTESSSRYLSERYLRVTEAQKGALGSEDHGFESQSLIWEPMACQMPQWSYFFWQLRWKFLIVTKRNFNTRIKWHLLIIGNWRRDQILARLIGLFNFYNLTFVSKNYYFKKIWFKRLTLTARVNRVSIASC